MDEKRQELVTVGPNQPLESNRPVIYGWDLGKTLLANAALSREKMRVEVARIASSWAPEYHRPEVVIPPKLKDNPSLSKRDEQLGEIRKSFALAGESLAVFATHINSFNLVGGLAFPMDSLIQSGVTPEEVLGDDVLLNFLAYFIKESGRCFEGVDEEIYMQNGVDKTTVVGAYKQNYVQLNATWGLSKFGKRSELDERISWSKR